MQRSNSRHRRKRDRHEGNSTAPNVKVGGSLGGDVEKRSELLAELLKSRVWDGVVTNEEVARIAGEFQLSPAEIFGVATFYSLLAPTKANQVPNGDLKKREQSNCRTIHVCDGPACRLAGARPVISDAGSVDLKRCSCLGLCDAAPAVMIERNDGTLQAAAPLTPDGSIAICTEEALPYPSPRNAHPLERRVLMKRIWNGHSKKGSSKELSQDYLALKAAVRLSPEELIERVEQSGLRGRGGAGFSTAKKWRMVGEAKSDRRFVICNADESEPGTFKDRVLMEHDPHLLIEGMLICGLAVGAREGIIYIRGEYVIAADALQTAVNEARASGMLGENVCGSKYSFDIQIHQGAGAYICGEETALLESLEGKRGEPRCRPPYPTQSGYRGFPTVVNNVETLCAVPSIISDIEFKADTKLFCLSGHVQRPGVYELPLGVTPRELIFDVAGGMKNESDFEFALCGGAAGEFIDASKLDVPLDYESHKQGVPLGSGVLMVADETVSITQFLLWVLEFFEHESCGKCTPCRIGTRQVREFVQRLHEGQETEFASDPEIVHLLELADLMETASLCGLGQSVALPIRSAIDCCQPEPETGTEKE